MDSIPYHPVSHVPSNRERKIMATIELLRLEANQKKFGDKTGVTLSAREAMMAAIDELENYRRIIRIIDEGGSILNHLDCVM